MADLRVLCVTPNGAGTADASSDKIHDHDHEILPFREKQLTVIELSKTPLPRSLEKVRGLAHLTVVCTDLDDLVGNDEQSEMWRRNAEKLMTMLRDKAMSPRSSDTLAGKEDSYDGFWPLYLGSKVGFGTSTLRDPVSRRQLVLKLGSLIDTIVFSKKTLPNWLEQMVQALLELNPDGDSPQVVASKPSEEASTKDQRGSLEEHPQEQLRLAGEN